jgi:hypothetical protein
MFDFNTTIVWCLLFSFTAMGGIVMILRFSFNPFKYSFLSSLLGVLIMAVSLICIAYLVRKEARLNLTNKQDLIIKAFQDNKELICTINNLGKKIVIKKENSNIIVSSFSKESDETKRIFVLSNGIAISVADCNILLENKI